MGQDDQVRKGEDPGELMSGNEFDDMQSHDRANETRILWSEIGVLALMAFLAAIYFIAA